MADAAAEIPFDPTAGRGRLARVYAGALFAAAGDAADAVGDELSDWVHGVLAADPAAARFLVSPAVARKAKTAALAAALAGRASPLLTNFLGVLDKNKRLGLAAEIAAAYRNLLDARAGRVRVTVTSAVPLTAPQLDALTQTLAGRLNASPVVTTIVDADLLGGLVVTVGDKVFDTSVRTRLETLRSQLMDQGSSYVLQQA